ncbi:MAG: 3'-phosphoesterase [Candidatus Aenigmarchaeota archaeon]|nr:3'-phosphoesterase [Candidatus Aenigmarchaeota archaeon]
MSQEQYQKKRNNPTTTKPQSKNPIYIIQQHNATRLHWDLRLEIDNTLKSWALPKEPPTEIGTKRLAVETQDHPIEYAAFEGTIPKGSYGAGEVKIWDKGTFTMIESDKDKLIIDIHAKQLNGTYALIKTRFAGSKSKNTWLFFKKKI